ncbi:COG3637 Opacity protein and related surface antigens [Rhabdaerophilaceae bacterium]
MKYNMRSTLICVALMSGVAFAPKSYASDYPQARSPVPSIAAGAGTWTGLYVGGNLSYGTGTANNADVSGFMVGGQAGFNTQFDKIVLGLEGDVTYSGVDYRGFTDAFQQKWVISGRARAGYAFDRFMPYITGGLAYMSGTLKVPTGRAEQGHYGYVLGLGGEAMLTSNISARIELLHYRFGSETYAVPALSRRTSVTTNAIRFGVNYRF